MHNPAEPEGKWSKIKSVRKIVYTEKHYEQKAKMQF